jgi:hypothetical protein
LVFETSQGKAAGEIDQGLLFRICGQLLGGILQSGQFAIRIEDVELSVIGHEASTIVAFIGAGSGHVGQARALAGRHFLEPRQQPVTGGRKIFQNIEPGAVRHDGDQIRRGHLLGDEVDRGIFGPHLIGLRHVRKIEE